MAISTDQLVRLQRELETQIVARDRGLLNDFPLERYIGFYDGLPRFVSYRFVPRDARDFCTAIEERADLDILEAYHRLVMIRLIRHCDQRIQSKQISTCVRSLLFKYLNRVVNDMEAARKRFYVNGNDLFAKDFAVCRLKLLPCGVELVDEHSGVSRSTLLKGGVKQFVMGLHFFIFRIGGFKPLYQIHFDRRLISEFNEEGYARLYLRIADLLELNPNIKGLMSGSWWHDPQLAHISPELMFIGKWPENFGAKLFLLGSSSQATVDATKFSPYRMSLYKQRRYVPRVYLLVWASKDLLAWAKEFRCRAKSYTC